MADKHRRVQLQGRAQLKQVGRVLGKRVPGRRVRGSTAAAPVVADDAVINGQLGQLSVPYASARSPAVDQNDRRSFAGVFVIQVDRVGDSEISHDPSARRAAPAINEHLPLTLITSRDE